MMSLFDEPAMKPISATGERYWNSLGEMATEPTADEVRWLHMIFAQTGYPYSEVPIGQGFQRRNGSAAMGLSPGYLMNPKTGKLEMQGLPYGSIPRILMLHICTESIRTKKRLVDMNRSMTKFLTEDLLIEASGGARGGLTAFRKQMNSTAASQMTIGLHYLDGKGGRGASTFNPESAISEYKIWDEKSLIGKYLWNTEVKLSESFFQSNMSHAVPLDFRAVQGLRKSPLMLDIYFNLAQRLHGIAPGKVECVTYAQLREQHGMDSYEMKIFKYRYLGYLKNVLRYYPEAKIEVTENGLSYRKSKPPIPRDLLITVDRQLEFSTKKV